MNLGAATVCPSSVRLSASVHACVVRLYFSLHVQPREGRAHAIQNQNSFKESHFTSRQRLSAQEITTLSGTIESQINEKQGVLTELLKTLDEDSAIVDWEESLQAMASRIQRLGPINLAAIDEYKLESERKDYLDQQNNELEEALTTLRNAIQKIDRETRTKFK